MTINRRLCIDVDNERLTKFHNMAARYFGKYRGSLTLGIIDAMDVWMNFVQSENPDMMRIPIPRPEWIVTADLKESIRARDNYKCANCGKTQEDNGRKLSVTRMDRDTRNTDPSNLISLCSTCLARANAKGGPIIIRGADEQGP